MSKVFTALSVSVDGYITGGDPGAGRGLGDATMLFDWYFNGDTPSTVFGGFRLSADSARVFDAAAGRVGASLAGRNTYDDSGWADGRTPHPNRSSYSATISCPGTSRAQAHLMSPRRRSSLGTTGRRSSRPASRTRSPPPGRSQATRTSH